MVVRIDPRSNIMVNSYISCKNHISYFLCFLSLFHEIWSTKLKKPYDIRIAQNGLDSTSATGKLTAGFLFLCAFPLLARNYVGLPILSPLRVKLFYLWFSYGLFEQEKYQVTSDWSYMLGQISGRNLPSTTLANAPPTTSPSKRSQMNPGSLIQAFKEDIQISVTRFSVQKIQAGGLLLSNPPSFTSEPRAHLHNHEEDNSAHTAWIAMQLMLPSHPYPPI